MIRIILITIIGFLSFKAQGQEYLDLARFSYYISPNSEFEDGSEGKTVSEFNLQLDLPTVINDKNAFITSFVGNLNNIGLHPNQENHTELYSLNFRLGLNTIYNDVWSGTYLLLPKLTTDFSNGLRTGYQIGFVALINRKVSTRLKYTYGIYTNTEEFGQLVVPLIGGYYLSESEKWEITALLPALFDVNYKISTKTSLGFNYDGIGTTYSIDNEFYEDAYVTRGVTQLYGYSQFRLTSSLYTRIKAGYEIRNYRVFDQDDKVSLSLASIYFGDNRKQLNTELMDNFLFKVEFIYRFNLPQDKTPVLNEKL